MDNSHKGQIRRNRTDARTCMECECTNEKGFCNNYFLYAVLRDMCRKPVGGIQHESNNNMAAMGKPTCNR